jgi:hypothetical protein
MTKKRFLCILCALVIIGALFVVFSRRDDAPVQSQVSSTQSDTWKTYQGAEGTITIKVPADFVPQDGTENFSFDIPEKSPYFATHLIKEARLDIIVHEKCSVIPGNPEGRAISTIETVINDTTFTKSIFSDAGAGNIYQTVEYATTKNGKCYEIALFLHSVNGEALYSDIPARIKKVNAQHDQDMANLIKLFDQVIATIVFVK